MAAESDPDAPGSAAARARYRRAARRAVRRVPFYREQCARAGRLLAEPDPTPTNAVPDPPYQLCAFNRPWSADAEPSLWAPDLLGLARSLRLAGCPAGPVLEVRDALFDARRLPGGLRRRRYGVLLGPSARVASATRRTELNAAAIAGIRAGPGTDVWVVGSPADLATLAELARSGSRAVLRLPVGALADAPPASSWVLLHDPVLGYVGARVPGCGEFHVDIPRVYPRVRDGLLTLSVPGRRRPVLLALVPEAAQAVTMSTCPRHGTPVLRPRVRSTR